MTAQTINRTFNSNSNLITAAKEKNNSFAYGVKKFFYNLVTLGFGKSMETARNDRRENEIVHVAFDVLNSFPKEHANLSNPSFDNKTLHTNFEKKYQIVQEKEDLCIYTGKVSQSPLNGKNYFDKNENSRIVLKTFYNEAEFSDFKNKLEQAKENPIYQNLQQQQQQQAATKIQRHYKMRIVQKDPYIASHKQIQMHMKKLSTLITKSGTAQKFNNEQISSDYRQQKHYSIAKKEPNRIKRALHSITISGIGDCGDLAVILYCLIKEDPLIHPDIKNSLKIEQLIPPDDHVFVTSNPTGNTKIVYDDWIRLLNLPKKPYYRDQNIPAGRAKGFIGTACDYLLFLRDHEDGVFLKKSGNHQIDLAPITMSRIENNRKVIYDCVYFPESFKKLDEEIKDSYSNGYRDIT